MIFKKTIKTLFIYFVTIIVLSCNTPSTHSDKPLQDQKRLNEFQAIFVNMRSNADKLVFKLNPDSNVRGDYDAVVWTDSIRDLKKMADFNLTF